MSAPDPRRSVARVRLSSIISSAADPPVGLAGEMSEGRVERRLAAILAVDVAGYSRLIGEARRARSQRCVRFAVIPLPAAPIAVRALPMDAKTRQWRSPVPQSEKNFFLNVNYLTLLDRFLNDAARGWANRGAHLANAG